MYKILIIILLIAFGVILFLYLQKSQCRVNGRRESMQTTIGSAPDLTERPWTDHGEDSIYHHIDLRGLERRPFIYSRREGVDRSASMRGPLRRLDRLYDLYDNHHDGGYQSNYNYNSNSNRDYDSHQDINRTEGSRKRGQEMSRLPINNNVIPAAYDDNPDLSLCPPCVCPGESLLESRMLRPLRS